MKRPIQFKIWVSKGERAEIDRLCERTGLDASSLVRALVRQALLSEKIEIPIVPRMRGSK